MPLPIFIIDAFADEPFTGNPAAVCLLDKNIDDPLRQQIAAEMNLSETAFVRPLEDKYELRWFTPTVEVDLCGHATLASAHALWEQGLVSQNDEITFTTRSGDLTCVRYADWIELDFPSILPFESDPPPTLLPAMGIISPKKIVKSRFDYLIELDSPEAVLAVAPDFRALAQIATRGVIVTARGGGPGLDFVSRFFAPALRIDEDPVTGSAHCLLAPYWGQILGKMTMTGRQISSRGGTVRMNWNDDRVTLSGKARTVMSGTLLD